MHYLDNLLECPVGSPLKETQLRRLLDSGNMAAALHQFFGAAYHLRVEVTAIIQLVQGFFSSDWLNRYHYFNLKETAYHWW